MNEFELQERAASAKALLNDPVVKLALDALRDQYVNEMISAEMGSPQMIKAHAGIRFLGEFLAHLQSMITDHKMMLKYRRDK